MSDKPKTRLLNVDLDLYAETDLSVLIEAMQPSTIVLNRENPKSASFEIATTEPQTIDEAILLYHHITMALPPTARSIWDSCTVRRLNIGIQAESEPYQVCFSMSSRSVALALEMGAEICTTVYSPVAEDDKVKT